MYIIYRGQFFFKSKILSSNFWGDWSVDNPSSNYSQKSNFHEARLSSNLQSQFSLIA